MASLHCTVVPPRHGGWQSLFTLDVCRGGSRTQPERLVQSVTDALRDKAAATLQKRANSLVLFVTWTSSVKREPFPFSEEAAYEYVCFLRAHDAPATRASSFLEAVAFASHVLGFEGGRDLALSRRLRGAALDLFMKKQLLRQRSPLTVKQLEHLEVLAAGAADTRKDQIFAGFCVLLVHLRSRFGDGMHICVEPFVDGHLVEAFVSTTKTSNRINRRRRLLCMVGFAFGVSGQPWAANWLRAREAEGLEASEGAPFMPRPLAGGGSGKPLSNAEATTWLRRLLCNEASQPQLQQVGMHSLKCTLLSWAAKYGLDLDTRRFLGYHVKSTDETPLLYSRDAAAAPVRSLGVVLKAVLNGSFDPDRTRSGYFADDRERSRSPTPVEASGSTHQDVCEDVWVEHVTSSSEDEADPEADGSPSESEVEAAVTEGGPLSAPRLGAATAADRQWFRHGQRGTYHVARKHEPERLACGRPVNAAYSACDPPSDPLVLCAQCFGQGASAPPAA